MVDLRQLKPKESTQANLWLWLIHRRFVFWVPIAWDSPSEMTWDAGIRGNYAGGDDMGALRGSEDGRGLRIEDVFVVILRLHNVWHCQNVDCGY